MVKDCKLNEYTNIGERFSFNPSGSENAPEMMLFVCV